MKIILLICFLKIVSAGIVDLTLQIVNDIINSPNTDEIKEYQTDVNLVDLVHEEGYKLEEHKLVTTDSYILTLHRIPKGKKGKSNGKVAFLMHGFLTSSADFIIAGPGKGLGYILADEGYDVWLGNARGNIYSRNHKFLNPDQHADYWQFSWHEMGTIDLPQMIDFVLERTQASEVYYAGHSQGTTVLYVMTSMLPKYNSKIKVGVSMSPIGYMSHMTSPLMKIIAFWTYPLALLSSVVGVNEFLPHHGFIKLLTDAICVSNSLTSTLCKNAMFAICGFSPEQMNSTMLPLMMTFTPAGASTKQLFHYTQEINSGMFRQYDYGGIKNFAIYNSLTPPVYPLSEIHVPIYMIHSANDWLSAPADVAKLCSELKNCNSYKIPHPEFNHVDFLYGIDAPNLVYNKIIEVFNKTI